MMLRGNLSLKNGKAQLITTLFEAVRPFGEGLLMRQEPMAQALLWSTVPAALAYVPGQAEAVHGDVTWALHSWQGAAGPSERS